MKVVVIGRRGMLAQELLVCLRRAGFTAFAKGRPEVDITQPVTIRRALQDIRPGILINAAAYTAVDKAESEKEMAFAVNQAGAAHLAEICEETRIPLIHVSTDYVFDGTATHPYHEDTPATPLGVYGRSKCEGEVAIQCICQEHLIIRTSWLYASHGTNFVKTILRLAREREILWVVTDQYGCPTWARELAGALVVICQRILWDKTKTPWGTYHYSGAGETNWNGFAQAIVEEARAFEPLVVEEVIPIPTSAYPTTARRPAYAVLDCRKILSAFGINPRPWRESLHDFIQELYA